MNRKQQDDKITNLEDEAQERIKRIGGLRAQISNLIREEKRMQLEYDEFQSRLAFLRQRSQELSQLKEEEATLNRDIKQQEKNHSTLIVELNRLQEIRLQLMPQIAKLRSKVEDEETETKKNVEEVSRLEKILNDNKARKEKIQENVKTLTKDEDELKALEETHTEITEHIPFTRKKYEQTKQLVEELEMRVNPISQAIMDIWQKLPPDVLDRQLVLPQNIMID